jgi:hypothetical protein
MYEQKTDVRLRMSYEHYVKLAHRIKVYKRPTIVKFSEILRKKLKLTIIDYSKVLKICRKDYYLILTGLAYPSSLFVLKLALIANLDSRKLNLLLHDYFAETTKNVDRYRQTAITKYIPDAMKEHLLKDIVAFKKAKKRYEQMHTNSNDSN